MSIPLSCNSFSTYETRKKPIYLNFGAQNIARRFNKTIEAALARGMIGPASAGGSLYAVGMDPDAYALHDVAQFPVVLTRRPHARPGAVQVWAHEMDMLAASPTPFVLIATDLNVDMNAADRRAMVAWQASNMARLRRRCAGFISIVPDPRAFGLPFLAVPTLAQARDRARELLAAFGAGQGGHTGRHPAGYLVGA